MPIVNWAELVRGWGYKGLGWFARRPAAAFQIVLSPSERLRSILQFRGVRVCVASIFRFDYGAQKFRHVFLNVRCHAHVFYKYIFKSVIVCYNIVYFIVIHSLHALNYLERARSGWGLVFRGICKRPPCKAPWTLALNPSERATALVLTIPRFLGNSEISHKIGDLGVHGYDAFVVYCAFHVDM